MPPDWAKLAEPFDASEVKQRPGRGGMTFSYVDARAVAQRLDDVLTPAGWTFEAKVIPGSDVVHGRLNIHTEDAYVWREDHGYPNSDADEEPIKAATSDALKRCAVLFGVGRHLYGDNKGTIRHPARPVPPPISLEQAQAASDAFKGRGTTRPSQTPPRSSTAVPQEPEFPDDWAERGMDKPATYKPEPFQPIGAVQPNLGEECPDHPGETWRGEVGSLYHRKPEGGYCRPEGQPKQARR